MSRRRERDDSSNTLVIILAVVGGVLVLGIIACGGLGVFLYRSAAPLGPAFGTMGQEVEMELAAEAFVDTLGEGNVDGAYQSTTAAFRRGQTLEQFRNFVQRQPLLRNHEVVESETVQATNGPNAASVKVTVEGKNGKKMTATVRLVKVGDDWQVDGFTVP